MKYNSSCDQGWLCGFRVWKATLYTFGTLKYTFLTRFRNQISSRLQNGLVCVLVLLVSKGYKFRGACILCQQLMIKEMYKCMAIIDTWNKCQIFHRGIHYIKLHLRATFNQFLTQRNSYVVIILSNCVRKKEINSIPNWFIILPWFACGKFSCSALSKIRNY